MTFWSTQKHTTSVQIPPQNKSIIEIDLPLDQMNRLPRVLQNEIWEYVHGDRPFWKQQFRRTMTELLLYTRAYFRDFPTGTTFLGMVKQPLQKKHRILAIDQVIRIVPQEAVIDAWNQRHSEIVHAIEEKRELFGIDHFGQAREYVLRLIQHYGE